MLGRFAEAVEDARRAVAIQPDEPRHRLLLGFLAVEAGNASETRAALDAFERTGGAGSPPARLLAASLAELEGDHALAERGLQELLRTAPDYAAARALLRRTAARAGHPESAERFLAELDAAGRGAEK